jgi:hypothetical protein
MGSGLPRYQKKNLDREIETPSPYEGEVGRG